MEKTLNIIDHIVTILFSILLIILIGCISILPIAKSKAYYLAQHEKNNVESILENYSFDGAKHTIYENDKFITHIHPTYDVQNSDIEYATEKIIDYLYHKDVESMQFQIVTENGAVDFFSEQAIVHMEDVKVLFIGGINLCYISIVLFILSIIYLIYRRNFIKKYITKTYIITVISFLALAIGIVIFAAIDFNTAFIVFHYIIFPDNSKAELAITFNSCDTLTNVLTSEFFMNIGIIIGITFIGLLITSIIISKVLEVHASGMILKIKNMFKK